MPLFFVGMTGIAVMGTQLLISLNTTQFLFHNQTMTTSCISCANLMRSEDQQVPLRCGIDYFKQPPSQRHPQRLDHYPPVDPDDSCAMWVGHAVSAVPISQESPNN